MTGFIDLALQGSARDRGRLQAGAAPESAVRAATLGRVAAARAEGIIDSAALAYVAAQHSFHAAADPGGMAELQGVASGFGLDAQELFLHLHLGTLRDLKGGGHIEDGCSAWAIADGQSGPMVVKNRDFSGLHLGVQTVARHAGPDVETGAMLCLGSLGSPGAYSSGMNARGLALADTQVPVRCHRIGWLRYFLMTRLLARCATVAEALALIRAVPHAGGGTLVMADAHGAVAAVELGAAGPQIATTSTVWRTNHFTSPALAADTLLPDGDRIAGTSQLRFDHLGATLSGRSWSVADAQTLMATHPEDGAPICQHGQEDGSCTIASVIYSCQAPGLLACAGNPCAGVWHSYPLAG